MKSQKAEKELYDGSWKVEVGFEDEEFDLPYYAVRVDVAEYAIELAEQEAEERMRAKAIEAFCAANCPKGCSFGADGNIGCGAKVRFIQKLSKE